MGLMLMALLSLGSALGALPCHGDGSCDFNQLCVEGQCIWTESVVTGKKGTPCNPDSTCDLFLTCSENTCTESEATQFSTMYREFGMRIEEDAAHNVYIAFTSWGNPLSIENSGQYDVFIVKYDAGGALLWKRHIGTEDFDMLTAARVAPDGSVWLAGKTMGAFPGYEKSCHTQELCWDMFAVHIASDGQLQYIEQFRNNSEQMTQIVPADIQIHNGTAYMLYRTYEDTGKIGIIGINEQYETALQISVKPDNLKSVTELSALAILSDGSFIAAGFGNLKENDDAFAVHISPDGSIVNSYMVQGPGYSMGGALEFADAVVADAENSVYLTLHMSYYIEFEGTTSQGGMDAFVIKLNSALEKIWVTPFTAPGGETAVTALYFDTAGRLLASGGTTGDIAGDGEGGGTSRNFIFTINPVNGEIIRKYVETVPSTSVSGILAHEDSLFLGGTTATQSYEKQYEERFAECVGFNCSDVYIRRIPYEM